MGRHKKYITDEEKRNAVNRNSMNYYWKHCKKIKRQNLKRYYDLKEKEINDSKSDN